MNFKSVYRTLIMILFASLLVCCRHPPSTSAPASFKSVAATSTSLPPSEITKSFLADYEFPTKIDPVKKYLFYLHGRIIEDQGLPAVSPDFGEYEYEAILKKLESQGFEVISEQRTKNTISADYAQKVTGQIRTLIDHGVPAENISVVGASKGAGIAVIVSSLLKDPKISFVLLGFCSPDTVRELVQNQVSLYGNVLAIRDTRDNLSGSCKELFDASEGKGLGQHDEVVLNIGTGHGILYKPLDEWVQPTVEWATDCECSE
jgi:hypothetical protein